MDDSAMLIVKEGPECGRRWHLDREDIVIGRTKGADITIDDRRISSAHAQISNRGGRYFLQDLGSKNGTYLNGESVRSPNLLTDGDEICLAMVVVFSFVDAGRTVPLTFEGRMERGLQLDGQTRRVLINGAEVDPPLSQAQFRLLDLLMQANGAVCTRDQIMAAVWPDEE